MSSKGWGGLGDVLKVIFGVLVSILIGRKLQ